MKITRPACGPRRANLPGQCQHVLEPRSPGHGPLPGSLNHRPIRQRIAERHAQLDHIRAGVDGRNRNRPRGLESSGSPAVR